MKDLIVVTPFRGMKPGEKIRLNDEIADLWIRKGIAVPAKPADRKSRARKVTTDGGQ